MLLQLFLLAILSFQGATGRRTPTDNPNRVDPCALVGNQPWSSVDEVVSCMLSFPFNLTVARSTIDTLSKTIPHYVFVDIAKDSPDKNLPSRVFLEAGLDLILAKAEAGGYASEYDFDMNIQALFHSLNDAHTLYTPNCFSQWLYLPPFPLASIMTNGQQKLVVPPAKISFEDTDYPTGITSEFEGWEVLEIDGVPAMDYMTEFADKKVGTAKDLNARFNTALFNIYFNISGQPEFDKGAFYLQTTAPARANITFLLTNTNGEHKTTVSRDYVAFFLGGESFSSSQEYFDKFCKPLEPEAASASSTSGRRKQVDDEMPSGVQDPLPQFEFGAPKFVSQYIPTGASVEENVGVVVIPTFTGEDFTTFIPELGRAFVEALKKLKTAGIERLIIDLTDNGGGYVVLANWMPNVLFPEKHMGLPTRWRANPLAQLAARKANELNATDSQFHWSEWAREGKGPALFSSLADGFFFPTENLTYGAVEYPWSQLANDMPLELFPKEFIPEELVRPFQEAPFKKENILIVTNGECGSSCSIFTSAMSQFHGVRTVTIGGIAGKPQQLSNFPGGQVQDLSVLYSELQKLGLEKHDLAPQPFLRNVGMRFTWRALYGPISDSTPLEFVFEPSTYNLEYTRENAFSPVALWGQVAKLFSTPCTKQQQHGNK